MRPHAIARTNPITSRPTRVRSGRSAHGPETAGASYGRRLRGWRVVLTLLFGSLLASACSGAMLTSVANAASAAQIAITADNPPPPAAPTGQASTYTINFTCSAVVGSSCGANPTITIPLDETSSNPATPPIGTWSYSSSSTISSLIASAKVIGGNYVITLNESALHPGDSDTINLSVTPPNNITPDATSWSLTPSFSTADIPTVTAPAPAIGQATAAAKLSVSKNTNDGGAVYVSGNNVIYTITARCNPGGATGNLYLQQGSLVDTLPAGLTFVSATPAPTTVAGNSVTWNYATAGSLPSGCAAGSSGSTTYTLTALLNASTPNNTQLTNGVTFTGTPIGTSTPLSTTATRSITAIITSPGNAGNFLGKTGRGPIDIAGFGYDATYAGHWITPVNPRPSNNPGAAEGEYTVSISYPASRAFQTDLADPVPCLDTHSGVVYSSNTPSGAINGSSSIDNLCQHPAFDPTVVAVNSASLATATATGTYTPAQSFAVNFTVQVPAGYVNTVAWNTAASDASYNGNPLLPAEPPKVGLTAAAPPVTPTLSTTTSTSDVVPGGSFTDSILVGNTGGASGTLDWKLVGPVAPTSGGTCAGLDWSSAATVVAGTISITGDGTYATPSSAPTGTGCYGYVEHLTGAAFAGPATSPAGSAGETVLVAEPADPSPPAAPAPGNGNAGTPDPVAQSTPATAPAPAQGARITIVKSVDNKLVTLGKPLTYTLTVTNSGPATATGLAVSDTPASKMRFVSVSTASGTCTRHLPMTCELNPLPAGTAATITVHAVPTTAGTAVNDAHVSSTQTTMAPDSVVSATASTSVVATLKPTDTASVRAVDAGGQLRYTVVVDNPTASTVRNVRACEALPAGLGFMSASAKTHLRAGRLCWTIAALAPHAHNVVSMRTYALRGAAGEVTDTVTITGSEIKTEHARASVMVVAAPQVETGVTG